AARAASSVRGGAAARANAQRFFAAHALAFDPRPRRGGMVSIPAGEIERRGGAIAEAWERYGRAALRLDEVIALDALPLGDARDAIVRLVSEGLPVFDVRRLSALGREEDLTSFEGDAEAAASYVSFAAALCAHYASLGLDVPLTPGLFHRLRRGTRKE